MPRQQDVAYKHIRGDRQRPGQSDFYNMPSEEKLKQWERLQNSAGLDDTEKLVENMPPIPTDVKQRFPSMHQYEEMQRGWIIKLIKAMRAG